MFVGAVDLVDQQDRGQRSGMLDGAQQRPFDQIVAGGTGRRAERAPGGLREADREQLPRVVPLVDGLGDVDALVALQPDQRGGQRGAERFCGGGLSGARLALEQHRLAEPHRAEQGGRETLVGEIPDSVQPGLQRRHVRNRGGERIAHGTVGSVGRSAQPAPR